MGVTPFFTKRPDEDFAIELDFTDEMPTGITLSSGTCSATRVIDGVSVTSTILAAGTSPTVNVSANTANIKIAAGDVGQQYDVLFRMTLSNAHHIEGVARVMVDA